MARKWAISSIITSEVHGNLEIPVWFRLNEPMGWTSSEKLATDFREESQARSLLAGMVDKLFPDAKAFVEEIKPTQREKTD